MDTFAVGVAVPGVAVLDGGKDSFIGVVGPPPRFGEDCVMGRFEMRVVESTDDDLLLPGRRRNVLCRNDGVDGVDFCGTGVLIDAGVGVVGDSVGKLSCLAFATAGGCGVSTGLPGGGGV